MPADYLGMSLSLLCAMLWASAVILFKKSGEQKVTPLSLNTIKNLVSVALYTLTLPLLGITFLPDISWQDWVIAGVSGVLGIGIGDAFFFSSLNRLGASLTAIVDCLYSPFMILLSVVFLSEPLSLALGLGTALVLAALILAKGEKPKKKRDSKRLLAGFAYGVTGLLALTSSVVMVKPLLTKTSVFWVLWWRMLWGFLALAVWMGLHPQRKKLVARLKPDASWKTVLPGVILGGYFATIAWLFGMRYTNVSVASVLNQLSTLFILLLAAIFLKEKLQRRHILAAFLGFAGACVLFLRHLVS